MQKKGYVSGSLTAITLKEWYCLESHRKLVLINEVFISSLALGPSHMGGTILGR